MAATEVPPVYRRANWDDNEVIFFLNLWSDVEVQKQLDGTVRNKKVFRDIAARMEEAGYRRSSDQLRDKLKKLKKEYKDAKKNNEKSGAGRQTCPFFDLLDDVLGHRPSIDPEVLVDTADIQGEESDDENDKSGAASDTGTTESEKETPPSQAGESSAESVPGPSSSDGLTATPNSTVRRKKRREPDSSREDQVEKLVKQLVDHQDRSRREYMEWQERREEAEERREERRRREDHEHEIRMFQMLGQMFGQSTQSRENVSFNQQGQSFFDL
ncbi:uncharacterized protein [Diadema antillarum]|uniref:uncharacterized protein n=1 Tax=Diadema antillarum TaxID=105358 RepID=UPI003A8A0562